MTGVNLRKPGWFVSNFTEQTLIDAGRTFEEMWLDGGEGPHGPAAFVGEFGAPAAPVVAVVPAPEVAPQSANAYPCGGIERCATPGVCSVVTHDRDFGWFESACLFSPLVPGGVRRDPALAGRTVIDA